jgi:type I restriction enzyme R subunit
MAALRLANAAITQPEAGWIHGQSCTHEHPVQGLPNASGDGFVDYVLWGDDGKPLALVEAKRSSGDPMDGQHQAKLYADALERQTGQRPLIFLSNGYRHRLWDDTRYPPRDVQGFYKKGELAPLIRRRDTRLPLADASISAAIVNRHYQVHAIRAIGDSLEKGRRKVLLVQATGTGKTRTAIALTDLLLRCNWIKRILFLADRNALVIQAQRAFRVFLSTDPTMMNLIDTEDSPGVRRFGVGTHKKAPALPAQIPEGGAMAPGGVSSGLRITTASRQAFLGLGSRMDDSRSRNSCRIAVAFGRHCSAVDVGRSAMLPISHPRPP